MKTYVDKYLHTIVSSTLTMGVYYSGLFGISLTGIQIPKWILLSLVVIIVVSIGLGKEVFDYFSPNHNCEIWDFIADCGGIILGIALILGFKI